MEHLKFPIGKFHFDENISDTFIEDGIVAIEKLPSLLNDAVRNYDSAQLDTNYRPDGWTIRQVIHHVADSHMNSYIRFKLALTEDTPIIKTYEEDLWAQSPDYKLPIHHSLSIIEHLHHRWGVVLRNMKKEDFDKKVFHPGFKKELSLTFLLALYKWHGEHHTAHCKLIVS